MVKRGFAILISFFVVTTVGGTILPLPESEGDRTIQILDSETDEPIPDVAVIDSRSGVYGISNPAGLVRRSPFMASDNVCFQHFAYDPLCLSADELERKGYIVRLNRRVFELEESIITARRREDRSEEIPNRITPVTRPVIEMGNPQTAADLLELTGEVFIQKSQQGGGSPMVRGFSANRLLLVVDGVRMNNAIYREGNVHSVTAIDPSVIERTEGVFGPGAAIYGSDAIGGVMSFSTRRPMVSLNDELNSSVEAYTRYSTASGEKTGHVTLNIGERRMALLSAFTYSDYGDLRMGRPQYDSYMRPDYVVREDGQDKVVANSDPRRQRFTGYNHLSAVNKLRFRASDNIDLMVSNIFTKVSSVPRYDRLIVRRDGELAFGDWYYGPQRWSLTTGTAEYSAPTALTDNLRVVAASQLFKESRHTSAFGSPHRRSQKERVDIFSVNIDAEKQSGSDNLIYYGAEFVMNDITSTARVTDIVEMSDSPAAPRYPDGDNRYTGYSIYTGYRHSFSPRLNINSGLRYNYSTLSSEIEDNSWYGFPFSEFSLSGGALTGSSGIVGVITEATTLTMNLSTGFRAPNLDDAGKVFDSAPGVVVVPNPDLRPEYAYNADFGFSTHLFQGVQLGANIFYTVLSDAMVRRDFLFNGADSIMYQGQLSRVEAIVNAGRANVYGLHINFVANLGRNLMFRSDINFTDGYDQDDVPLRHTAPLFGSARLIFENERLEADIYTLFNGSKSFDRMAPSERSKPHIYAEDDEGRPYSPAWATLNMKFSWRLSGWATFTGGVENILDLGYRPYSSGVVAPGRNFIFALRVRV